MAKLIYLASPIDQAPNGFAVRRLDIKTKLHNMGYSVFDPSQAFVALHGTEQIQAVNNVAIRNSNGVFVFYPPDAQSVGVPREMRFAYSLGIPYVICRTEADFPVCVSELEKLMDPQDEIEQAWIPWVQAVTNELDRAQTKFPKSSSNMADDWFGIFIEEVMEVTQAWNDWNAGRGGTREQIEDELVQVGAMAGRFWMRMRGLPGPSETESSTTTPEGGGS